MTDCGHRIGAETPARVGPLPACPRDHAGGVTAFLALAVDGFPRLWCQGLSLSGRPCPYTREITADEENP